MAAALLRNRFILLPAFSLYFDHPADLPQVRKSGRDRDDVFRALQHSPLPVLAGGADGPGAFKTFRRTRALDSGRSRAADPGGGAVSAALMEHLAAGRDGSGGTPADHGRGIRLSDKRSATPRHPGQCGGDAVSTPFAATRERHRTVESGADLRPHAP